MLITMWLCSADGNKKNPVTFMPPGSSFFVVVSIFRCKRVCLSSFPTSLYIPSHPFYLSPSRNFQTFVNPHIDAMIFILHAEVMIVFFSLLN